MSTWYKCMIFRMLCRELNEMRLEYVLKCRERYVKLNLTIGLKCDIDVSALKKRGRVQQKDELLHRDESLKETSTPFMSQSGRN